VINQVVPTEMAIDLAVLGDTLFISRLPATYNECGWLIAEAVAANTWEEVGALAHTQPTQHRPVTSYKAYEARSHFTGRHIAQLWCTPARRTNGDSNG